MSRSSLGIVLTLFMLAATSASASASTEFEAEASWTAAGEHQVFKLGAATGECKNIKITGVSPKSARSPTALLKPTYTGCTAVLNGTKTSVTVNTGECEYELHNLQGESPYTAEANLVNCTGGITVKAAAGLCIVTIPEQSNTKAGSGKNLKTEKGSFESEATADLIGFKYTTKGTCGIESGSNGEYTGSAIAKGLIAK